MTRSNQIICIGSVLWDIIGRTTHEMPPGADRPGCIHRRPGGVAMNIAIALRRAGLSPILLSHVGDDPEGAALIASVASRGLQTGYILRTTDHPTDVYMAIEGPEGLVAAVADAKGLELAGEKILMPLIDGPLGTVDAPFTGAIALDGNLTLPLLTRISKSRVFAPADLRLAPASPGKAKRLCPMLNHPRATFYVNLEEAGLIAGASFRDAPEAAAGLVAKGATRALVTDGPRAAAYHGVEGGESFTPPKVAALHFTGAGNSFMAAHIAAELGGANPKDALETAVLAAVRHVREGPGL